MKFSQIASIDTALEIYWRYPELSNKEIMRLFGKLGHGTLLKYKRAALDEQIARGVKTSGAHTVNTRVAFDVWGIDAEDLEKRRAMDNTTLNAIYIELLNMNNTLKELTAAVRESGSPKEPDCRDVADKAAEILAERLSRVLEKRSDNDAKFQG